MRERQTTYIILKTKNMSKVKDVREVTGLPDNKNEELAKNLDIPNTPFKARWDADRKVWFATCGKYRITEPMQTLDELTQYVNEKNWELIFTVIGIVITENNIEETKRDKQWQKAVKSENNNNTNN